MSLVVVIFLDRLWFRFDFGVLSQMLFGAMCSRLRCLSWSARVGAGAGKVPQTSNATAIRSSLCDEQKFFVVS